MGIHSNLGGFFLEAFESSANLLVKSSASVSNVTLVK